MSLLYSYVLDRKKHFIFCHNCADSIIMQFLTITLVLNSFQKKAGIILCSKKICHADINQPLQISFLSRQMQVLPSTTCS